VSTLLNDSGFSSGGLIEDANRCTTTKSRVLASNHQLIRLDREDVQPVDSAIEKVVLNYVSKKINSVDLILISDYNKGLLTNTLLSQIFDLCQKAGKKTLVDPKGHDFSKYKGAALIKPNKKEASQATGVIIKDKESLKNACTKIQQITGCESVVVTLSDEGIAMYSNNELQVIPTKALSVIDVTGAGDTVLASLGVAIASGNSLKSACDFANHAAAIVVSKVGSAVATLEEINKTTINL
jgi:D-beta-D-heptose 7-phosphate kinase/D-beta-D-heptose 1-phosphate adenosyltransferase